jgi:hypothetical protein
MMSYDDSTDPLDGSRASCELDSSKAPQTGHHQLRSKLSNLITTGGGPEVTADLGEVKTICQLKSVIKDVKTLPNYQIYYPPVIKEALANLFMEYNQAFKEIVARNREFPNDYRYCQNSNASAIPLKKAAPLNYIVQVDMVGLTDNFLSLAQDCSEAEVRESIRQGIFEIENSLAMYQLLERIFARDGEVGAFSPKFREVLDEIREVHKKSIAILAVTEEKLKSIRAMEFGREDERVLTDSEVLKLSGFDALLGPQDFLEHLSKNSGECRYLLYVRASDPVEKLKNPAVMLDNPLLENPRLRSIIRANTITLNVDGPNSAARDRINDTKEYLLKMGMGFKVDSIGSLIDVELVQAIAKKVGKVVLEEKMLSPEFKDYLRGVNINPQQLLSGEVLLRGKPLRGCYGCYGHVRGHLGMSEFRGELTRGIKKSGEYVIQPEIKTPTIKNLKDGTRYTFIDRNFLACTGGEVKFLGGFRTMISVDSNEAKRGRIHGSQDSVYGEIL